MGDTTTTPPVNLPTNTTTTPPRNTTTNPPTNTTTNPPTNTTTNPPTKTLKYGILLKAIKDKKFSELLQDLQTKSGKISSYISELNSIIRSGQVPTVPATTPNYSILQDLEKPISFLTNPLKTTADVANDDINQLLFQQNTMYIMGTITCATLIVSALYFAKEK